MKKTQKRNNRNTRKNKNTRKRKSAGSKVAFSENTTQYDLPPTERKNTSYQYYPKCPPLVYPCKLQYTLVENIEDHANLVKELETGKSTSEEKKKHIQKVLHQQIQPITTLTPRKKSKNV